MIRAASQKRWSLHFPLLGEPRSVVVDPGTLQCGASTELCHSFEIGMTDIRVAPIDAVLLTDDACRTLGNVRSTMLD